MTAANLPVSEGTRVYVNFSLSLEDGSEVDSNFGGEPVAFEVGDGSLLPGFERLLFGMSAGQRRLFTVSPEHGFGQPMTTTCSTCRAPGLPLTTIWKLASCSPSRMPVAASCPG